MNDFKMDLMEYMKEHKRTLEGAPLGMYAITSIPEEFKNTIKPGLIFTLRQVNGIAEMTEQNALYPNYMVYITEDGTVKYNYVNAKKILDYYKKLCLEHENVLPELVALFNDETNNGQDMSKYSTLLEEAVQNIVGKKEEIGLTSIFARSGTNLQKNLFSKMEDFEFISFLVIK